MRRFRPFRSGAGLEAEEDRPETEPHQERRRLDFEVARFLLKIADFFNLLVLSIYLSLFL